MSGIEKYDEREEFEGEHGESLVVTYDNRGDPYSEGITLEVDDGGARSYVYLKKNDANRLRALIDRLYP